MLAVDDAVQGEAERIELPLQRAEGVPAAVGVVRGKRDEALLGEAEGEGLVRAPCGTRAVVGDRVLRQAFQPVLADDDGPALVQLEVLRQAQPAPGKHIFPDIERDFMETRTDRIKRRPRSRPTSSSIPRTRSTSEFIFATRSAVAPALKKVGKRLKSSSRPSQS